MADDVRVLLGLINGKSKVNVYVGEYRGLSDDRKLLVDVGGSRVPVETLTPYRPSLNESVWVWFVDERPFMMGPVEPKAATGTVLSVADGLLVLSTDMGELKDVPYGGEEPAVGVSVRLHWSDGPYALSVPSADVAAPPVPDPPTATGEVKSPEFRAIDSGQFYSRWQNNALRASDNVSGAYFYGTAIADTIPADARNVSGQVYLPLVQEMGECRIGRHAFASMPDGWTGSTDEVALSPRGGWVAVPAPILAALIAAPGGITLVSGNGDNRWNGTQLDGLSGCLRITYTS
ncbi:hypothetical protein [Herbiconiux sp. VKM Ac-2851]|uniref:hypothetical protein n=1 Tax=Herbiconiux sp. VKM Ac-2851 TaxID=2739025 RepID=UPI001565EF6E|nr:hypothetical protein [Herbiconiux sp. VKM Ac-2851]NQX36245.1 hypothetical protein [Herbiconiux sp. VKM Ac-2851]